MASKPRNAPPTPVTGEADTAEETAPAVAATNWDSVYILATTVFLITAIVLVLREAGIHYGAGPFGGK